MGTTAYPSLKCGGELVLDKVEEESIVLRENLTYGAGTTTGTCLNNGIVTVNMTEETTIIFSWRSGFHPSTGTATLNKIDDNGTDTPDGFIGVWRGQGVQVEPRIQWSILFGLTKGSIGSIVGTTAYPSLRCGGELTLQEVSTETIKLLEDITYGSCVDQGIITLSIVSGNLMDYKYEETANDPMPSTGSLTRVLPHQLYLPLLIH